MDHHLTVVHWAVMHWSVVTSTQAKASYSELWENENSNADNLCEKPLKRRSEHGNDILIPALMGRRAGTNPYKY